MGLLDFLGENGGLVNFLQNNGLNQQSPGGLPSDTANYGSGNPAPFSMAGPTPAIASAAPGSATAPVQQAATAPMSFGGPASAQPQPSASIPTPATAPLSLGGAASPGIGDRLGASAQSFANSGGLLPALANGFTSLITGQRTDPTGIAQAKTQQQKLDLIAGLRARGVSNMDITAALANPEYLKKVLDNDVAEDKTPTGFTKNDDGSLHYTPGGPADPNYLRTKETQSTDPNAVKVAGRGAELYRTDAKGNVVILHKNVENTEATLDDPTTSAMASQYLAGDKGVMQNLGRGAQGAANIVKLRTEIYNQANAQGLNGKDIVNNFNEQAGNLAGQRSIGTRSANISLAANEASNMIPIALAASDKLPRTQYMPWNQMVQTVQKGTSSPELASFVAATNSLVNSYVRAVSPSGVPTDSMRQHAYDMLNAAQGPDAYRAVISTMRQEMSAALQAPSQVRKELRGEPAQAPAGAAPGAGKPAVVNQNGHTYSLQPDGSYM